MDNLSIEQFSEDDRVEKINDVEVLASGLDYDIINPPNIKIIDQVGIGATGYLGVSGTLKEIRITDRGSTSVSYTHLTLPTKA